MPGHRLTDFLAPEDRPRFQQHLARLVRGDGQQVLELRLATPQGESRWVTLQMSLVAEEWHPDAAVLDIGMQDMNGYELCRRLPAQSWGRKLLLIACTGWGQDSDRELARGAGFDHHLVKPVDSEAMLRLLSEEPLPPV